MSLKIADMFRKKENETTPAQVELPRYLGSFEPQDITEDNDPFLYSLEHLTAADLDPEAAANAGRKKKTDLYTLIRTAVTVFCACVFLYCVVQIVIIGVNYKMADDIYGEYAKGYEEAVNAASERRVAFLNTVSADLPMKNYADVLATGITIYTPGESGASSGATSLRFQKTLAFLDKLKRTNPDTFGFININGTEVSYPVVQSDNNSFYLDHSFEGTTLKSGAIFADFRNVRNVTSNENLVLYGHNMTNGAMFHEVTRYLEEDFFRSTDIEISTFDGIYTFRVFAVYPAKATEDYFQTDFANDTSFLNFCYRARERSLYKKDEIVFSPDSVLLTLSTCITGEPNGRYAVHAVLVGIEK